MQALVIPIKKREKANKKYLEEVKSYREIISQLKNDIRERDVQIDHLNKSIDRYRGLLRKYKINDD